MTYMIPRTYQQMTLLFSSPQLENGSYTIYTGGSVTDGSSFYGLYTGAIYDGGTQAATFTANSMVTQIGSASGGGNPGGGGGPWWGTRRLGMVITAGLAIKTCPLSILFAESG
ncbi:hypothetical protein NXV73_16395 [Bacteroides salyersiae]|nr:hypothetical protein [Bacteroides salyersiae]